MTDPKIIVALDYPQAEAALTLADQLDPTLCRLKVGKELFTRSGPPILQALQDRGFQIFLDLKYHDIPHTVARACAAAADAGVWMVNVHTLGGGAMMQAARDAIGNHPQSPLLIGVTLLTSMDDHTFSQIGLRGNIEDTVIRLARLAADSGLDGVVCSAQETPALRTALGDDFKLVTPGIRPTGSQKDDQHRTLTPVEAIQAGSHYLVIGRPITGAADPLNMLMSINTSLTAMSD